MFKQTAWAARMQRRARSGLFGRFVAQCLSAHLPNQIGINLPTSAATFAAEIYASLLQVAGWISAGTRLAEHHSRCW